MRESEMEKIAHIIQQTLLQPNETELIEALKNKSLALCKNFPLPY
jgi:glycine/serine hydroxymethyltransferase